MHVYHNMRRKKVAGKKITEAVRDIQRVIYFFVNFHLPCFN
jgi:hypothetical protein